jgi:MoaA/NifB/PqqE/SkfB family radical SAM enzyme
VVSVHGADARHHDAQTRAPGSFRQALQGLRTLDALRASFPLTDHTSTVVSRRNLARVTEIYRILASFRVDQVVFNVIKPDGNAATHFDRLTPRFPEVRAAFDRLIAEEPGAASRACLLDMPPCTTVGLPSRVRGWVERYRYFEAEDEAPGRARRVLKSGGGGRVMESDRRREGVPMEMGPPCAGCAARRRCDGVWTQYAARYGWDEFHPIAPRRRPGAGR